MTLTRIAVVGLGGAAEQLHLPAIQQTPGVALVGVADPDPARRQSAIDRSIALPRDTFASQAELIARLRPDIVIIGTPPETHAALCEEALAAGCHVFCEKPLAPTVEECDRIVAAADAAGRFVAVDNQYRHLSIYRAARAAIDRGDFGKPYLLQMWQQMDSPGEGFPQWKAQLQHLILYEFGTHATDLVAYLLGGPRGPMANGGDAYPDALTTRILKTPRDGGLDLVSNTRFDFPRDVIATMMLNWRSRAPQRYLEVRLDCEQASLRMSLGGVAKFRIGWSSEQRRPNLGFSFVRGGEVRVERHGSSRVLAQERPAGWVTATAEHLGRFIASVKAGQEPEGSARHARELLRTALASYESAEAGSGLVQINRPAAIGA